MITAYHWYLVYGEVWPFFFFGIGYLGSACLVVGGILTCITAIKEYCNDKQKKDWRL